MHLGGGGGRGGPTDLGRFGWWGDLGGGDDLGGVCLKM